MMKYRLLLTALLSAAVSMSKAQDSLRTSSSIYLQPLEKSDVTLFFDIAAEGKRYAPTWGLDLAWINEQNLRKGVRHMGKENVGIGRSAFRATVALINDTSLGTDQISKLRERSNFFTSVVSADLPLVLTADQEAGAVEYYVKNKSCNTDHWAAMINAHVAWMQKNTKHPVAGVSPYNEPDYWTTEEGATVAKQVEVAKKLREDYADTMEGVVLVGGNTLNNDKALDWYQTGKAYYDWGNTHQLAGSFDTFAKFYETLAADGKTGYADEMHNVGEAMVGLEYGLTTGIWWGFDSRARGEFCDISRHGERLAYGEHRNNWTAASVYRHDDGRVKAFIGSSERQAKTTTYQFISPGRDLYFDTYGPVRTHRMEIPGGTAYQTGQSNAERVIDVTWGEDVPHVAITEGTYRIVNKATKTYVNAVSNIAMQQNFPKSKTQQWNVHWCDPRIGGDYSFLDFESVSNSKLRMNVENFSTLDKANVIGFSQNATPSSNEQWYLEYAGDGFFYIRNRETATYLTTASSVGSNGVRVQMRDLQTDSTLRDRQLWRLLPAGIVYDTEAPAQPTGLTATAQSASVRLSWKANNDQDLRGYTIFRAEQTPNSSPLTPDFSVIARDVQGISYVDNDCRPGHNYIYKVRAMDQSLNLSEAAESAAVTVPTAPAMTARWTFDSTVLDATANFFDPAVYGDTVFVNGPDQLQSQSSNLNSQPLKALSLNAKRYVQLPYEVASHDELTFCAWVKVITTSAWQRIFDFGNGTDQYMFLTPTTGSVMRFAIKDGGEEQLLDCPSRLHTNQWKHVAVTIGTGHTAIYIDGEEVAATDAITIRPSDFCPAINYLGRSQYASDPALTGYYSDVRIYNHALSADEVRKVMAGEVPSERLKGDVNGDGSVDVADISSIITVMAGASSNLPQSGEASAADVNGDGTVDVADISTVITIMAAQ